MLRLAFETAASWTSPRSLARLLAAGARRRVPVLGEPIRDFRRARRGVPAGRGAGRAPPRLPPRGRAQPGAGGVPRSVAMKTTGYRTEAVYRRYTIASDADLRDTARRLGTFLDTLRGARLKRAL